jgi:hypothetical protein
MKYVHAITSLNRPSDPRYAAMCDSGIGSKRQAVGKIRLRSAM